MVLCAFSPPKGRCLRGLDCLPERREREKDGETDFILFGRVFFSTELKRELALGQRRFTPPFVSDKIIAPPRCYCEQVKNYIFDEVLLRTVG